jgi:hypothetical protein
MSTKGYVAPLSDPNSKFGSNNIDRIGSNLARLEMKTVPQTLKLPPKELQARMEPLSKNLQSLGSEPRTMPPSAIPPVPSARKSLNRLGPRMFKIGSGKTQSRSDLECTMLVVIPKSPRVLLRLAKRGLARLTQYWASAKPR